MPRFFCDNILDCSVTVAGDDAKHIRKVLRMRPGEKLMVSDMRGYDYECSIISFGEDTVTLHILERFENQTEPKVKITLYQALPKGDKMDFIIQKAVEMGVAEIVPVMTKRCVARFDEAAFSKKLPRLERISLEAAKQCGRGMIPAISGLHTFDAAVERMQRETSIVFYEKGGESVSRIISSEIMQISVFIGSEGGFDEIEIESLKANGIRCATLGRRVLRCETAPIAALTLILNAVGEM